MEAARATLEQFCDERAVSLDDLKGADLPRAHKQTRIKAAIATRRATPASYEVIGQLLETCPDALRSSVRSSLELPHW